MTAASSDGGGGGEAPPSNPLFAAINARREKQEARMKKIESGEMVAEDPREKREREMKEEKQARLRGKMP